MDGQDRMGKQVHSRSLRLRGLLLLELLCNDRSVRDEGGLLSVIGYLGCKQGFELSLNFKLFFNMVKGG